MKIVMVLSHLEIGGAEKQTINLAKGLAEKGMNPVLFVFRERGQLIKEVPAGVEVVFSDFQPVPPFKTPIKIFALIKALRKLNPCLVYTRLEHAPVAIAGKVAGIPTVVVHVDNPKKPNAVTFKQKKDNFISFLWKRLSAKLATRTVANSEGLAICCRKHLKLKSKPSVIYNGTDTTLIKEKSRGKAEHEWVRNKTVPLIVSVSRLAEHKGLGTLIEAFAIVNNNMKARLLIVGDGGMKSQLNEKIINLGLENEVSLTGWKVNPYPFIAAADLYVSPSTREGFSNSLLEAMTLGIPVVSTDHKFGANEMIENGKDGILVPVSDPKAMAEGIERVLRDIKLRNKHPEMWRKVGKGQNFTIEKMTSDYMSLFEKTVGNE